MTTGSTLPPVPRVGSLFSGVGGLCELGVAPALGGRVVWHCEVDPAAAAVLAHHWPGTPNLGDVAEVEWAAVPPVDVLVGGFPCTDVSQAGRQVGLAPGTRSGLWCHMARAVEVLRPQLVVVENVWGLLSAPTVGQVEPCPWCVGDGGAGGMRALGAVLGDLADCGYDAEWICLPASDVGAPHARQRVFVAAVPAAAYAAVA
jgi:DNA (cytosine-5)-methyltransferase 1